MNGSAETVGWTRQVQFETAEDLLKALYPFGDVLPRFPDSIPWIYRGERTATRELIPTAHRKDGIQTLKEITFFSKARVPDDMLLASWIRESEAIKQFLIRSDIAGLHFPDDRVEQREKLSEVIDYFRRIEDSNISGKKLTSFDPSRSWIPLSLLPFVAIAQHYSIPTCLLDWSLSPFAAAYFAAIRAIRSAQQDGNMVVFALRADDQRIASLLKVPFSTVTVPRASNPNLHAQEGVFTYLRQFTSPEQQLIPLAIDSLLANCRAPTDSHAPLLVKLLLPADKSPELLWYLDQMGVNAGKLFPGFAGAAAATLNYRLARMPE